MKTTDLDAVAPLYPVNKTAGRVMAKGEHWQPKGLSKDILEKNRAHTRNPLQTSRPPRDPGFTDLTGIKFGRLTVIGYGRSKNFSPRALWVVRCVCGAYEHRRSRAIKTADPEASCQECQKLAYLRKRSSSVKRA